MICTRSANTGSSVTRPSFARFTNGSFPIGAKECNLDLVSERSKTSTDKVPLRAQVLPTLKGEDPAVYAGYSGRLLELQSDPFYSSGNITGLGCCLPYAFVYDLAHENSRGHRRTEAV